MSLRPGGRDKCVPVGLLSVPSVVVLPAVGPSAARRVVVGHPGEIWLLLPVMIRNTYIDDAKLS
jgi:hypothetical protein